MSQKELEIVKKISDLSMTTPANHWAIIQSIKHISLNKPGDLLSVVYFKVEI